MRHSVLVRDLGPGRRFLRRGRWLTVERIQPVRGSSHLVRIVTREGPTLMLLDVEAVEVAPEEAR